jgi:hypothetical protein
MTVLSNTKRVAQAGAAVLAMFTAACASSPTTPSASDVGIAASVITTDNTPVAGQVKVCKFFYSAATTASDPSTGIAEFTISASGGTLLSSSAFLNSGECAIVWEGAQGSVTVSEIVAGKPYSLFAGFVLKPGADGSQTIADFTTNPSYTATIDAGTPGVAIWFKNTPSDVPPPTQSGQGCTPGYWRQSQHFGSYTAPITPSTRFESVFTDFAGFPNNGTWLQAVTLKGGAFNALIRHTAAAYLNALSPNVDYDLTPAQVIATYNAAVASGDWDNAKNIFSALNEQGSPHGRAE